MTTLTLSPGTFKQSTFDKVGAGLDYDTIYLTKGNYTINTPIKLNSGTTITGDKWVMDDKGDIIDPGAVINLAPKMPVKTFPAGIPVFGQKNSSISNVIVENITFDGHSGEQIVSHGKSFHILMMLKNGSNLTCHDVIIKSSQGDGIRAVNFNNVKYYNNRVYGCGHEGLYVEVCKNIEAYNNFTYLRSNSAMRARDCIGAWFHHNNIYRIDKYGPAYGPGIQVQVDKSSSDIYIYENTIMHTFGPGIWIAGLKSTDPNAGSNIRAYNNLIVDCGQMPAANKLPGVGAITCDGWNNVVIDKNTIDHCRNGIRFGSFVGNSVGSGYVAAIRDNIITNTIKSNYPDAASGSAIANLITKKYTVLCENNNLFANKMNYVNTTGTGYSVNPLFVGDGDYHLQSSSPCVFASGELGRYAGTSEAVKLSTITNTNPAELIGKDKAVIIVCDDEDDAVTLSNAIKDADLLDDEKMVVYIPDDE